MTRLIITLLLVLFLGGCAGNQPPVVKITTPSENALLDERTVSFSGEWSDPDGDVQSVFWNFGDGHTSSDENPTHTYAQGGTYTVELTVTDNRGAKATSRIRFSINQEPIAYATARVQDVPESVPSKFISGEPPLAVAFSSAGTRDPDGKVASLSWSFGDGQFSDEPHPTHVYTEPGTYDVVLTVVDDRGAVAQDTSITVEVKSPEPTIFTVGDVSYRLYDRSEIAPSPGEKALLYRYVLTEPHRLTREQIEAILLNAIDRLKQRPRLSALYVWLFAQAKHNFMSPSDYDHFLGSAHWEARGQEKPTLLLNKKYLDGTAPTVYGYRVLFKSHLEPETEGCPACRDHRIAHVEVFLEGETFCRDGVIHTLREALRALAGAEGYLIEIYGQDVTFPLGAAVGAIHMPVDLLPKGLLQLKPERWDVELENLKLYLPAIPEC
ncbi:MAG: PKD domain-containing protein [Candidatus Bipolaricaulota bacterium]|nr:PKD domain-containing protein [Candidatus Bipolaricaulota bacterium]MCS7273981.1 PKD domain-containing protein [Candidatus Bipolaricaulota bacterium]MDW8111334.1 PKD domain-containing protein [Candidatus Bipolaricaulota bacterium]MDW8329246.1 PKD domain-containing protein [Candidatus Bipolaricaulota bacterium]